MTTATEVAAFDFDGTLAHGDAVVPFVVKAAGLPKAALALGTAVPFLSASLADRSFRDQAKARLTRAFKGLDEQLLVDIGQGFAAERMARLNLEVVDRLAWHRSHGHRTVIVSASYDIYMRHFAALLNVDDVIATQVEIADGVATGRLDGANVRGAEKAAQLKGLLGSSLGSTTLWAYGNSSDDHAMMDLAKHAFLVDKAGIPKPWRT